MQKFLGLGVALVTPFKEDRSVDYDALKNLVEYNISNGTNYLVINGTTAESATISRGEREAIIKVIATVNAGRVPLVLGVGGNNTMQVVEELQTIDLAAIDAILSVAPYYSKPTQEGFYQHFKAIALASPKPIILYNVPGRTAKNMLPETTLRLARDFDNIIGVKEAGNIQQQYYTLLRDKPKDFLVISGDDDLALGVVLAGGAGVISVIGQGLPKEFSEMIALGLQGKNTEAYAIHYQLMEVIALIFEENNPAGIKALLKHKGITFDFVRLPLVEASKALQVKIKTFLDNRA
ncbi:4-hydroxy-tetrahydrodipicolinate synthase [Tenacibaculum sp. SG-28]|uniref:4-hydroxy-tetrahydrodipicolinate synthase n=1 Tax=Tenacibaculum sp. SG-28 TaxID=754426 RepID=UPI000CF56BC1|nr:4-hydroxy-tetrahydrodipicolinate synthase [Tenacibaculum sp. SG-28]PQJ23509.1 4-hydroxy-tetrahydrodipicolinate synthase [Tenacibaculum sp. SG-28]